MPRIKKVFPRLPESVLQEIDQRRDQLLPLICYEGFMLGDKVRRRYTGTLLYTIVGFVILHGFSCTHAIVKEGDSYGRYGGGYHVYETEYLFPV